MAREKMRKAAAVRPPPELADSGPVFDRIRRLTMALFPQCAARIVLVGQGAAWRSHDPGGLPPDAPLARTAVEEDRLLWVADINLEPRFANRIAADSPWQPRLVAAAPIRLEDHTIPGALVVAGPRAMPFDADLAGRLQDLADVVAGEWSRARSYAARETAHRERDAANNMVANFIEAAPISMIVTDLDMRIISISPPRMKGRGLTPRQVVGRSMYEIFPYTEQWRQDHLRCLKGETIQSDRVEVVRPDGSINWSKGAITPWRDGAGRIGGLIIATHDVTEMVEAIERIERSEERLKMALEIADVHVWELDFRRRVLMTTGVQASFYDKDYTYAELTKDIWSIIDPRDRPAVEAAWDRHVREGAPYRPEYRVARNDGKEVWVQAATLLEQDVNGRPVRLIGALQNITERKMAEQALIQAKDEAESATRAKSAFLATMSHEIRTPLNGVLGMAQAMATDELGAEQRERLDVIRQSGESLLAILNDVLDLSKIEAGKLDLEQAEFDLEETARDALRAFAATAQAKGLSLDLTVQPAAHGVYRGDSVRVRQILYNLISNGLKFTERGGVKVVLGRRGKTLRLRVADTGIGVASEKLSGLFQKFEQADASTTRRYGGTGLGLAICRDLAELMGGQIRADSRLGQGSTFTVEIPLERTGAAAQRSVQQPPERPSSDARALRVLAAEDNGMNQLVLRTLLNQVGVEPVMVANGKEAVEAWSREPWDLILMDVQMPEMDGPTATGMIRARERAERRPRTPIVALTANAMAHQVAEYALAGMDDFVAKPIEAGRLYAVIEAVLMRTESGSTENAA